MEDSEENDPNVMLPHMLFDQESHDLICPVCEHAVTGEVILQKRKRDLEPVESGETPHGIRASLLHEDSTLPSLSVRVTHDSSADSSEEEEAEMRHALHNQTNYELLCPDCESCITHEVILQKRKRATSTSDSLPRKTHQHLHPGPEIGEVEERDHSDEADPPLKRHRRSRKAIVAADSEGREIRRALQNQGIYDLSCPDCDSHVTYQVILKSKATASGRPVGLLEKKRRRRRKFVTSYVDDNPWRTRYKRAHGHSKPISAAKADKLHSRKDALSRARAKYGDIETGSLAEPLLPVQQQAGDEALPTRTILGRYRHFISSKFEEIFGPCAISYFLLMIFLYCVWWLLQVV